MRVNNLKINLLYVVTKLELGGAQKQLLSLISGLDKERFSPFLFTSSDGLLFSEALSINNLTLRSSKFLERPIRPFQDLLALIEIYRFIKKNDIRIVHTHSSKAGLLGRLAAKLAGVKIIIHTVHGWSFNDCQPYIFRRLFISLERFTGSFTDKLIVVSDYDRQKGLSNNIAKEDRYSLIRYGIDYREFSRETKDVKKELGLGPKDLVVTNISCLKPQKSPLDFIKLAYLTKKTLFRRDAINNRTQGSCAVKFLLVGDGVLRKKIEGLIKKLNLGEDVILAGWRRDIPDILAATDVLTINSLWEGLPIAALEAMASACPVVATDTGGIREAVFSARTGFLVPPKDTKGMLERLLVLLKDEKARRQMGEAARDSLGQDFRLENMVTQTQDLYYSLIKERGCVCLTRV